MNDNEILLAAQNGNRDIANSYLRNGGNPDMTSEYGMSLLHLACANGQAEIAADLLEHNANINAQSRRQKTPLHMAAERGRDEIVNLLVSNGAETEARDDLNRTYQDYLRDVRIDAAIRKLHPDKYGRR
ncbi:MAG: ankyrin repeat domain-containing protein [Patescibacteria group bacterium]|jgi:ankyrin repeat protein